MPERNTVSWTTVISEFARDGKCRLALSLFQEMWRKGVELDQVALIAVLSACAELGDFELGRWIHLYLLEKICVDGKLFVSLNNALVHVYASCGLIDEAYEIFRKMPHGTTVSWTGTALRCTALRLSYDITGFARHGFADEALGVFEMMLGLEKNEVKPDEVIFLGVLTACSRADYVNEGHRVFDSMSRKWGIDPRHYGCMVDILSRAVHVEEAYKLIPLMMPTKPNEAIWRALLDGCMTRRNPQIAALAARNLLAELDPSDAAEYLLLLSEVYDATGRQEGLESMKQRMLDIGVTKPPGCSWVQVEEAVHDFLDDDMTHRHADSLYEMLLRITQARWEGYELG